MSSPPRPPPASRSTSAAAPICPPSPPCSRPPTASSSATRARRTSPPRSAPRSCPCSRRSCRWSGGGRGASRPGSGRPASGLPRFRRARLPRAGSSLPVARPRRRRRRRGRAHCPAASGPADPGKERGVRVRILAWHVHGSWMTAFVHSRHDVLVPVTPDRGPDGLGRATTYAWPARVREASPQEIADTAADGDSTSSCCSGSRTSSCSRPGPGAARASTCLPCTSSTTPRGGTSPAGGTRSRTAATSRSSTSRPSTPRCGTTGTRRCGSSSTASPTPATSTPARWRPSRSRATNQCAVPGSPAPTSRPGSRARSPCTCTA